MVGATTPVDAATDFPTLADLEEAACRRTPPAVWGYVQGGAGEETALAANRAAFRRRTIRPRVLAGLRTIDLGTTLLHQGVGVPFFIAPTAYHGALHPDAEIGTARAAAGARALAIISTLSSCSLEQIAEAAPEGRRWFQLYLQPDLKDTQDLAARAEKAGFTGLVLTVDTPMLGVRDRQKRAGFAIDSSVPIGNGAHIRPPSRGPVWDGSQFSLREDASATWDILDRLRSVTSLPLVVKGVLTAEDARRAAGSGASAIIVSNHGGRQLDCAPATLDVLPEVVAAAGPKVEVYLDGGIRRGGDILLALASGARAVGIGRPILWALAVGGGAGVAQYLSVLREELAMTMALAGLSRVSEITPALLGPPRPW
jgi:4-hydroxymandelate oxidase